MNAKVAVLLILTVLLVLTAGGFAGLWVYAQLQRNDARDSARQLRRDAESTDLKLQRTQQEFKSLRDDFEPAVATRLQQEREQLTLQSTSRNSSDEQTIRKLADDLAAQRDQAARTLSERDALKAEYEKLSTRMAESGRYIEQAEAKIRTLENANKAALAQVQEQRALADKAQAEAKAAAQRPSAEIDKLRIDLAKSQGEAEALRSVVEELRRQLGPATVAPAAPRDLRGTVMSARDGLITLNVGKSDGVAAGMELAVWRGNAQIGSIRVTQVLTSTCTATAIKTDRPIATGDRVAAQ